MKFGTHNSYRLHEPWTFSSLFSMYSLWSVVRICLNISSLFLPGEVSEVYSPIKGGGGGGSQKGFTLDLGKRGGGGQKSLKVDIISFGIFF